MCLQDEATSALDAESEALVQKALDGLIWSGSRTCVLVAHRLSTVVNAHSIVVVDKGKAVEQGSHAALLEQKAVYASLVAHQLQKQREQLSDAPPNGAALPPADGIDSLFDSTESKDAAAAASSSSQEEEHEGE